MKLTEYARIAAERDQLIRNARSAGVSVSEIARILGMSRSHVSELANAR